LKQEIKEAKLAAEDRWGRNLQYLLVMSLQGIVYYEIFTDIFK
jgi:hypothetical protein